MSTPTAPPSSDGRQLIICCDGTNNNFTGRYNDTNVVKLLELLKQMPDPEDKRLVYYDPGVGNPAQLPAATWTDSWSRLKDRVAGLAFGKGVFENILQGYLWLMQHYQDGDELYFFGFSRGAFTARSIAGMVNAFGILPSSMASMADTLMAVYFSKRQDALDLQHHQAITQQVRDLMLSPQRRDVFIQYVGVWDTVASVGLKPFDVRMSAVPNVEDKRFLNIRHALALDEQRAQFEPRLYANPNGRYSAYSGATVTLEQRWFPGSHCDVGGYYTQNQCALSDQCFAWIVSEATACGLRIELEGEQAVLRELQTAGLANTGAPVIHSQLHSQALWAWAGMAARDPRRVLLDNMAPMHIAAQAHPRSEQALRFPQDTVWSKPMAAIPWWIWCALVILPILMGYLHSETEFKGPFVQDLLTIVRNLIPWVSNNFSFAQWQLGGWLTNSPGLLDTVKHLPAVQANPIGAVWLDFAFILIYAAVLAPWVARHYAFWLRLSSVAAIPTKATVWAGRLLPLTMLLDIAENILTLLTLHSVNWGWTMLPYFFAGLMSLAAAAKWLGLLLIVLFPLLMRWIKPYENATPSS